MLQWKREILIDADLAAPDRGADGIEAIDDLADCAGGAALGGEARGFDFDAGAQFHDVEDRRAAATAGRSRCAAARRAFSGDEGADALARDDETVGAQGGHRLAHHRAAHPGRRDQFLLGRQARPRGDLAAGDVVGEPRDQLSGEASAAPTAAASPKGSSVACSSS